MVKPGEWKRPSCEGGACAEVRVTGNNIYIRSTEFPDDVIAFTYREWAAFVDGVKAGEFDIDQA